MHVEISNHGKLSQKWAFRRPRCSFRLTTSVISKVKTCLGRPRKGSTTSSSTRGMPSATAVDTMSNGSISPDLDDMWHHGYPVSPQ